MLVVFDSVLPYYFLWWA